MDFRGSVKRTYSRRSHNMKAPPSDDGSPKSGATPKRRKRDILNGSQSHPLNTVNSMVRSARSRFSGPISIPADEDEIGETMVVDDANEGEVQPSLHSSFEAFRKQIAQSQGKAKKIKNPRLDLEEDAAGHVGKSLARSINGSQSVNKIGKMLSSLNYNIVAPAMAGAGGLIPGLGQHVRKPSVRARGAGGKVEAERMDVDHTAKVIVRTGARDVLKEKHYRALKSPSPDTNMMRMPLSAAQAELWDRNQNKSPFLGLPPEIRNMIYELALGNKTIAIHHNGSFTKSFRYVAHVQDTRYNPFAHVNGTRPGPFHDYIPPDTPSSTGLSLLSGVCRQLYLETHTSWAFTHNTWAFATPLHMWNFLYHAPKLSVAQMASIEELVVTQEPPNEKLLLCLRGLKVVRLVNAWSNEFPRGGRYVVERDAKGARLVREKWVPGKYR